MESKEDNFQEAYVLEQKLQNLILQKQEIHMELSETKMSKEEMEKSDEVYKIIGQLLIKSNGENLAKTLLEKEKLLQTRLDSLDKQTKILSEKLNALRKEVV